MAMLSGTVLLDGPACLFWNLCVLEHLIRFNDYIIHLVACAVYVH